MKHFPIETNEKVVSEFTRFYYERTLPEFNWGEKLYVLYEGKLRAAIPLWSAMVKVPSRTQASLETAIYTGVDIAGVGKTKIRMDGVYGANFFRSKEDYDMFLAGKKTEYKPWEVKIEMVLRHFGAVLRECACWEKVVMGWYMGQAKPEQGGIRFKDVWIDEDGYHATLLPKSVYSDSKDKYYLTREDCIKDNEREVVEFDTQEEEKGEGIMDETNNHNPELVKEINLKWDKFRPFFKPILCALYERDMEEIYNSDAFQFEGSMDDAFKNLCDEWDFHASNYLQHIADDQDLETIIEFVRYDVVEDYS